MTPVRAIRVSDLDETSRPGEFMWLSQSGHPEAGWVMLNFMCPCGCGREGGVTIDTPFTSKQGETPRWWWDGNEERPTLKPSIDWRLPDGQGGTVSHWHGYLTEGIFAPC
ncbi:hypothetical protein CPT_Sansa9 [Caulobacter phage Sansa]|uniref:Uncharacterized protein n=1 Tax=Caulobacter phage Sansa TaxID=1675600 RepID=A0A0K1LMK2_9CAUD|nr:hypothetical protein HOR07_gp009 [Caulobacter phage Sansa]AKU43413.1 hypothetical protein CPT_Sansa9 [Caulobacter phage Sansa]